MRAFVLSCLILTACGPPPTPPETPQPPAPAGQSIGIGTVNAWTVTGTLDKEQLPEALPSLPLQNKTLPTPPPDLPKPPASCSAFAAKKAPPAKCDDRASALVSLDAALSEGDRQKRDLALQALASCAHLPAGSMTALRADLAPVQCADSIVRPALEKAGAMDGAMHDALFGLGLAGMLSRTVTAAPVLEGSRKKDDVKAFIDSAMRPWATTHARVLQDLSSAGAKLRYYGKAIVAVEAGLADMRFVDAMRAVPIPEEFVDDKALRDAYQISLEDTLEPRKRRGRDAALVGLGSLATIGVIRDERVRRARDLLSKMFGGSRIDALDVVMLPPLKPVAPATAEQRLASRLQTFYAGVIFPPEAAHDEALLRQLIENGVSLPHRIALAKKELTGQARLLYARARFELGQNYWRHVDFDEATRLIVEWPGDKPDEARLLLALGIAMQGGPKNAAEMMVVAPTGKLGIGNVAALDALAGEGGALKGSAAFDAALLAQLAAPADADAAYWRNVASRFREAAGLIVDLPVKRDAEARAKEADEVAQAIKRR